MPIAAEKFVLLTTFRKTGAEVATPVWIVPVSDGRAGFFTADGVGKVKRLRNNPRLTLQPSNYGGRVTPGSVAVAGTGEIVKSGPLFDEVNASIRKKYGRIPVAMSRVMSGLVLRRRGLKRVDVVVLVTLD